MGRRADTARAYEVRARTWFRPATSGADGTWPIRAMALGRAEETTMTCIGTML
ncbi:hypothetical protein OJ997_11380 [Solirubrobacter phytolaccae]|uniref:Uncharacterized protein n=1 Tax=Solirubrobacter phytolaccae TaxID=1404360 RepID=A0A9X3NGS8_9ACTN|nr:hypothetical protein [Solirubrobacter phytolaccae]MDA0180897.1 hypothetical protein [Solirubrobacter phytolaccae]